VELYKKAYSGMIGLSWIGLIGYMRFFGPLRVFTALVLACLQDMFKFMLFMVVLMVCFASTFYFADFEGWENYGKIQGLLFTQYRWIFGDWEVDPQWDGYHIFLFVCCSFLMTLIMTNLLIAILSDTYARIMGNLEISDQYELNDLIFKLENFMLWNRGRGTEQHLVYAAYDNEMTGNWGGGADASANKIKKNMKELETAFSSQIKAKEKEIISSLKRMIDKNIGRALPQE